MKNFLFQINVLPQNYILHLQLILLLRQSAHKTNALVAGIMEIGLFQFLPITSFSTRVKGKSSWQHSPLLWKCLSLDKF